jgi:hypothetical protein
LLKEKSTGGAGGFLKIRNNASFECGIAGWGM